MNDSDVGDVSMSVMTEVDSMASHDDLTSQTPEAKHERASLTPEPSAEGGKPMLGKTRRSVTFQDNMVPGSTLSSEHNGKHAVASIPEENTEEAGPQEAGQQETTPPEVGDVDGKGSHEENTTL